MNSRWTAFTLLVGGCAIVASAGAGVAQDAHVVPQAKRNANVLPVHTQMPHNHTHIKAQPWHLSNIQKLHLIG